MSCAAELEDHLRAQWQMLAVLKHNRVLLNQFRSVLEEVLEERLHGMGIKRVSSRASVAGLFLTV